MSITFNGIPQEPRRSKLAFAEQKSADSYGFVPDKTRKDSSADSNDKYLKTFVENKSNITKVQNWSHMNMSTAQGGALLGNAYTGASFDGRYMYYIPRDSNTFVRFDTQGTFITDSDWSQMNMSTAQGGAVLNNAYRGASFDGRYIYFVPYDSDTFVRFDTQGVFTTAGDWDQMNMSTAQGGGLLNSAYVGASFDGRYVYYVPWDSDTFVRFDTQGTFTTAGDWDQMNMSTAQGGAELNGAYRSASFDGRYIYFVPLTSDTFVRFDTQGVFTTAGDWDQMNMSTAQGGTEVEYAYMSSCFDGRYVYYTPHASDTFLRFDTQGVFTTTGDWDQMNMSTAQGGVELDNAYVGASFDGRYVYYAPRYSDTFLRFDTQGDFTTAGDWDQMNMSTAQGGAELDDAYRDASFDGRYIYFGPNDSNTFLRFEAMWSKGAFI